MPIILDSHHREFDPASGSWTPQPLKADLQTPARAKVGCAIVGIALLVLAVALIVSSVMRP